MVQSYKNESKSQLERITKIQTEGCDVWIQKLQK